ncbi:hypothetical protein BGZ47_002221 [Haplosporangium gracile]|nr:hypothetical protein BGZ47_002221 [Haplosporangium gracile]
MPRFSIFYFPLVIDAICKDLSANAIFHCRKTSKALHKAFFRPHWKDITVREILTTNELETIRKYASWIRILTIDYPEEDIGATYDLEDTILPVLPELTLLTRMDITLEENFNLKLLVEILNASLDSKPNKLERICLRGANESANKDLYLIPLIKASSELQALRIPSVSNDHVKSFMEALGESCPKLQYLVLNKHKADHSWGSKAPLFKHIRQPLEMLRIDLTEDKYGDSSAVISTLLKYSAESLQELRLHNVDGLSTERSWPNWWKRARI